MKRPFFILMMAALLFVTGCTLSTLTTTATTTATSTSQTTTTTTTTDARSLPVTAELDRIALLIPEWIRADFTLPASSDESVTLLYEAQNGSIEQGVLKYLPTHQDEIITLSITAEYSGFQATRTFYIVCVRDNDQYEQHLIDVAFDEIEALLVAAFPTQIESDFTMPEVEYEDTTFRYSVSTSHVYNGRFIFPFPTTGSFLTVNVRVNYKNNIREIPVSIFMKGWNDLRQIPIVNINTKNNETVTSKDYYVEATLSLVVFDASNQPSEVYTNVPIEIRARGNSTLWMPKRSYRVKFAEKTPFLSEYAERDWVLLANFADQTLIRNKLAFDLARSMNMAFAPMAEFVDIYMNGSYDGNYMLTDQIEVTRNRVNIEEKSLGIDTGYLIELDARQGMEGEVEGWDYFNLYGFRYAIKSPQTDSAYYSVNQLYYIESYMLDVYSAIRNLQPYDHLIDEASWVDWFIVNELFKNVDSGFSSVYYYKDRGGKLKMGPVWDFDLSTSNPGHLVESERQPLGWYTSLYHKNRLFHYLMQSPQFQQALKARWNEIYDHQIKDMVDSIYPIADSIAKSRVENFSRWDVIGKNYEWYTSTEVYAAKTYEEQVEILYDYLMIRKVWMNEEINKF